MAEKFVLDQEEMIARFFQDSAFIGVGSHLPAYRFVWTVNEELDMRFIRDAENDVALRGKKNTEPTFFAVYHFEALSKGIKHIIFCAKSGKARLLPEVGQIDFIWMLQSNNPSEDASLLKHHLIAIPNIQFVTILEAENLERIVNLMM